MNLFSNLIASIMAWFWLLVIAGTLYILWPLKEIIAADRMNVLFNLPYYLRPDRQMIFIILVFVYGIAFCRLWSGWFPSQKLPKRIFGFLMGVVMSICLLWFYERYFEPGFLRTIFRFPVVQIGIRAIARVASMTFPITCVGTWI